MFLALVPKKEGEKSISECRPTSLFHGVYKIKVKALAIRLAPSWIG